MKNYLNAFISITVLLISSPIEAETIHKAETARAAEPKTINKTITTRVLNKQMKRVPGVTVVIPQTRMIAPARAIRKEATIRPTLVLIKDYNIRRGCLTGDLQLGEALQIFKEYFENSDYNGQHDITGIRFTRDRETRDTVYQVDLCPIVRYNDNVGNELEASFFVDMTGEIFITERQIN